MEYGDSERDECCMNVLQVFPFKTMPLIVDLIEEGETSIGAIRSSTGMCSFDSTEVSDMLAYLTSFGRVRPNDDGWTIQKVDEEANYDRFRKAFLKDAAAILSQLSDEPKSVNQLSQETGLPTELVDLYLPFLAEITRLGVISRCSLEHPVTWCQKS